MKSRFYNSQIWIFAGLFAFLAFLAVSFQNFTFKSEPLSFGADDSSDMQTALINEVQSSDEEKNRRREAMENGVFDKFQQKRDVDSIHIDTGEVYEGGPHHDVRAQGAKDL